jgi:hypothetical protein
MTEAEWLACEDPETMLDFLYDKASQRKLRLFACACCSRVRDRFAYRRFWELVELCERFADGQAKRKEVKSLTRHLMNPVFHDMEGFDASLRVAGECNFAGMVSRKDAYEARDAELAAHACASYVAGRWVPYRDGDERAPAYFSEATEQCRLLRDVVGNPFRPIVLAADWVNPTVVVLARTVYDERAFDRLPILADALEDAGCADAALLDHCRGPGPHVRGCWVVDLILGKK